jgi:hypothetical protein
VATLDILTEAEGSAAINAGAVVHAELPGLITGISGQIDDLCGPVVAREVTEYHDGGRESILLRTSPIMSVTSVTEYDSAGTSTTLTAATPSTKPADGYLLDSRGLIAQIFRRSGGGRATFTIGEQNVVVVTSAGRFADTASVDEMFKSAAKSILRAVWQQEAPRWAQQSDFIDDSEVGLVSSYVSVADMVKRRLPREMLIGGIA